MDSTYNRLLAFISDVFNNTVSGAPTGDVSVSGLIDAGNLQIGTKLLAQPASQPATVKGIEANGEPRDWAVAGQITTLHLVGIEEEHLKVGDVLVLDKDQRVPADVVVLKSFSLEAAAEKDIAAQSSANGALLEEPDELLIFRRSP